MPGCRIPVAAATTLMAICVGVASAAPAIVTPPPIGAGSCPSQIVPRQEVRDLTQAQWTRYITAVRTLQARATPATASMYDRLAYLHKQYSGSIHHFPLFLPWHRLFVRTFEYDLQQIDPGVAVPYWDWTRDASRLAGAPFWSTTLLGGNGRGARHIVNAGQFAGWQPKYGQRSGGQGRPPGLVRQWRDTRDLGQTEAAAKVDAAVANSDTYEEFLDQIETPHDQVHDLIGGDMQDPEFSPNDPVFWMHHAYIDKLWADWQNSAPKHFFDYGGRQASGDAKPTDKLPGFGDITVRDVMQLSSLCVKYDDTLAMQPTTTTLRTSASSIKPRQDVIYIATVSRVEAGGTVDFDEVGGKRLCRRVQPVFAVNTWTAVCKTNTSKLTHGPGRTTIVANYSGDSSNGASSGSVRQTIVRAQPTVLWDPAPEIQYGASLGENIKAFKTDPGRVTYTTLQTAAVPLTGTLNGAPVTTGTPEVPVTRSTILSAGYHVLLLHYVPRKGPPQLLTRQFVVKPGFLLVRPKPQRITTQDPTPVLTFEVDGFIDGETMESELSGFLQPVCRADRSDGLSQTAPRPAGTYTIFCSGGNALNYTVDTSATATLEVVEPDDPNAGKPPEELPPVSLGHGPPRILHSVCSTFLAGGTTRLYCGRIKLVHKARIVIKRGHSVLSGGTARRRGTLLELRPKAGARLKPGRYKLVLLTRDGKRRLIKIRVIPPARAERASAGARPTSLAALCRIHNVNVLLGYHRRADGVRVSRWRVYQTPG